MKETFCCECGKKGQWPVCSSCKKSNTEENTPKKEKTQLKEHHPDYFEAIIQNRTKIKNDVEKEILKTISRLQEKRKFTSWKKEDDFYFSDVKVAKIVARSIVKNLNLNTKESRKQTGYDRTKGKRKFKWNICIRNND